jgi:hypothetical protein
MTASTPMSIFHQWLLAETAGQETACAIVLHGGAAATGDQLVLDISDYLNEYDDESDGRWLPATRELVRKVAQDPNHRRLLHMDDDPAPDCDFETEYLNTLTALGMHGHVVLEAPEPECAITSSENAFHVGLDSGRSIKNTCHMILNPELIEPDSIAHIVGDVFLGWLHSQSLRNNPIHQLRREL